MNCNPMKDTEKWAWMGQFCERNGLRLDFEGECGFGRECVGVLGPGNKYPDYYWFDPVTYERADANGEVWAPSSAYHKHTCVAVLGRDEEAKEQLYQWLQWFDANGFVHEHGWKTVDQPELGPVAYMLGQHRYSRMVRKTSQIAPSPAVSYTAPPTSTRVLIGSGPLTFDSLRHANLRRLPEFKNAHGEPAHSSLDGSDWSLGEWCSATLGELGEAANIIKKVRRGDMTLDEARPLLAREFADVVIYLDLLAYRAGVDLGQAVVEKWNATSEKIGSALRLGDRP